MRASWSRYSSRELNLCAQGVGMVEARRITTTADLNFESRIVRMAPERSTTPIVKPSASYTSVVQAKYESGGAVQTVLSSMPSKRPPLMHSFKTFTRSDKIVQAQRI